MKVIEAIEKVITVRRLYLEVKYAEAINGYFGDAQYKAMLKNELNQRLEELTFIEKELKNNLAKENEE